MRETLAKAASHVPSLRPRLRAGQAEASTQTLASPLSLGPFLGSIYNVYIYIYMYVYLYYINIFI